MSTLNNPLANLVSKGNALQEQGRLIEAEQFYRQVLLIQPNYLDAHINLADLLKKSKRWKEAETAYQTLSLIFYHAALFNEAEQSMRYVLTLNPHNIDAHNNLAALCKKQNRLEEAEAHLREAFAINPDYALTCANLGMVLKDQSAPGKLEEAEQLLQRAVQLDPDQAEVHNGLGLILKMANRLDEAETSLRRALQLNPNHIEAHNNLGVVLNEKNCSEQAEMHFARAIELHPAYAEAYDNLATVLNRTKQLEKAEQVWRRLLTLKPHDIKTHNQLGALYMATGRLEAAEQHWRQILTLDPDYVKARSNLGLLDLLRGRFSEGWRNYEYRPKGNSLGIDAKTLPYPEWHGEALAGRRLLLLHEQGFGDQIQFIRYAQLLDEQGAIVEATISEELATLMQSAAGVTRWHTSMPTQPYDYWTYMMSTPRWLGTELTTIPASQRYLQAEASKTARWRERLQSLAPQRRKVGLVWAGNPDHANDRFRSAALATFAAWFTLPGIAWFALQKGKEEEIQTLKTFQAELATTAQPHFHALGAELHDFSDTAAVIEALDLVIAVDTSIIHLAAALGKPVWTLLPANPDWRWLLERTDSPWYPTIKFFRQTELGEWAPVIENVQKALQEWREIDN